MQAEGLDHEVIGAEIQAADASLNLLTRSKHKDGQLGVGGAHLGQRLLTVLARQVKVKDGEIGRVLTIGSDGLDAIGSTADAVTIRLQATGEELRQSAVILGYKQFHGIHSSAERWREDAAIGIPLISS
jgi:hypothetical protein